MWGSSRAAHRLQEAVDNFGWTDGEIIDVQLSVTATFVADRGCVYQRVPLALNRRVDKGAGACAGDVPTRGHGAQSFEARAPSGARAPQDEVRAFAHPTK